MKHSEYLEKIEQFLEKIKEKNLLFWNLWCFNYLLEKINKEHELYEGIKSCYETIWKYYESKINKVEFEQSSVWSFILEFDDDDYDDLDDFNITEKAIKELIDGFERVYLEIVNNKQQNYNADQLPFNLIDVEIEGIKITNSNINDIYINEAKAHLALANELISTSNNYSYKEKDIYRK